MSSKVRPFPSIRLNRSESRDRVALTLAELMNEIPYSEIKVVDLMHASGLSRSTFYRNFQTVDDVIMYAYMSYIQDIMDAGTVGSVTSDTNMAHMAHVLAEVTWEHRVALAAYHRSGLTSRIIEAGYNMVDATDPESYDGLLLVMHTAMISGWFYIWGERYTDASMEEMEGLLTCLLKSLMSRVTE